jgi:hypothetical protein
MPASSSSSVSASAVGSASSKTAPGPDLQRFIQHSVSIGSFLSALDDYEPTIPEQVARYHMQKSGVEGNDARMVKLLSLAADNFLAKTIYEARQTSLLRTQAGPSSKAQSKAGQKRKVSRMCPVAGGRWRVRDLYSPSIFCHVSYSVLCTIYLV